MEDSRGNQAFARRGLSQTVVALGVVSLLTDISSEMIYTQVPVFLTVVLGAPAAAVGLIEGVAESTASLLRLVSGWLSDRSGRRKPLTVMGYALGAVTKPLLALAVSWPFVLLLRFLDRAGKGLRTAPRDALITETTPPAARGRAFGLHRAMDTTGAVIGPLLGIAILRALPHGEAHLAHNLRGLFACAAVPGTLAVLTLLAFVREPDTKKPGGRAPDPAPAVIPVWQELSPDYRRFLFIVLLFQLGNSSDAFLILRARTLGFSAEQLLWLYAAFNVVEALLGYAAGALSDRFGRRPLIEAGYLVFAVVYAGFALANRQWMIWPLFLLYGLYYTLTQGTQRALAADLASEARRATQIGAYHMVTGLAVLPASVVAGLLFDLSPAVPFVVGACTATASAVLLRMGFRSASP
ncbi:MAG: MFS transporter [Chloroherpetonaceae bacterium]|nr:MFS transporter [Chthonomonadaceae bacterium]MDW8209130.1 MFS transporter [Chloroherpetonaceae bacterium]